MSESSESSKRTAPPVSPDTCEDEKRISVGRPCTMRTFSFVVVIEAGDAIVAVANVRVPEVGEGDDFATDLTFLVQVPELGSDGGRISPSFLGRVNVAVEAEEDVVGTRGSSWASMAPLDMVE